MDATAALNCYREQLKKYIDFNEAEWIIFSQHLSIGQLKKKQYFAEPGKVCDKVAVMIKGTVRYYHVKDGQEITGYFSFENEFVTSYKSFLTGLPGLTYIQALEDCLLITFTHRDLDQMLANPMLAYKVEKFGRLVAEETIICYEDRVASFITQTPEERYLQLYNTGRDILRRMPQHYIANYLGITPVSLSRIRRRILLTSKQETL